jgi:hypothetical protein
LVELEVAGYAQRQPIGEGGLRKGNVQVICWVVPRQPAKPSTGDVHDYNLPANVLKLVHRFHIKLPADFVATGDYKASMIAAAGRYEKAVKVAASKLKKAFIVAPGAPAYKEERKSLKENTERGEVDPNSSSTTTAVKIAPLDHVVVANEVRKYGSMTDAAVSKFNAECRRRAPECETGDIVLVISQIGQTISKNAKNPVGILVSSVPYAVAVYIAGSRKEQAMAAGSTRREAEEPREATPEEIEEYKSRGTYILKKR